MVGNVTFVRNAMSCWQHTCKWQTKKAAMCGSSANLENIIHFREPIQEVRRRGQPRQLSWHLEKSLCIRTRWQIFQVTSLKLHAESVIPKKFGLQRLSCKHHVSSVTGSMVNIYWVAMHIHFMWTFFHYIVPSLLETFIHASLFNMPLTNQNRPFIRQTFPIISCAGRISRQGVQPLGVWSVIQSPIARLR